MLNRLLLFNPELALKCHVNRRSRSAFVFNFHWNTLRLQQLNDFLLAASGQGDILGQLLGAINHPRLIVYRQPVCLSLIELGIMKSSHANEGINLWRRQPHLFYVQHVDENQIDFLWQRLRKKWRPTVPLWSVPRHFIFFIS